MQVDEQTAFLEPKVEAELARYLEYVLTGWAVRTGRKGTWYVMAFVTGDK